MHTITLFAVLIAGYLGRLAGTLLMLALPSMAAVDGVASRVGVSQMIVWIIYISLPYFVIATGVIISLLKNRLKPGRAYGSVLTVVLLPAFALLLNWIFGQSIQSAGIFWAFFPLVHLGIAVLLYHFVIGKIKSSD